MEKIADFCSIFAIGGGIYEPGVFIGDGVYISYRFTALSAAPINIGPNCLFASGVVVTSFNHGTNPEIDNSYAKTPLSTASVNIGEGCWIGENVIINMGVTLGKRCIVGAGAVVTSSFPDYSMVAGVPAKIIKTYSFEKHKWISVKP